MERAANRHFLGIDSKRSRPDYHSMLTILARQAADFDGPEAGDMAQDILLLQLRHMPKPDND